MTSPFLDLSRPALLNLALALERGRLNLPTTVTALSGLVPPELCEAVESEINYLYTSGTNATHIAYTLKIMAAERYAAQGERDKVDLVWTRHELTGSESRDTSVVVQELFSSAKQSVLIASYALDRGAKARHLFQGLADKLDDNPELEVQMFLNVQRPYRDERPNSILLRQFAKEFRHEQWPGERLPELFYDPRALAMSQQGRGCLHAKCVVVDELRILVTSANFTEAAHERNIEAGILIADPWAARAMRKQFQILVGRGILLRIPGV